VNALTGASSTLRELARSRVGGARLPVTIALAASTILVITGATALPSRGPVAQAAPAPVPEAQPVPYLGAAATPAPAQPALDADAHAQRFTGRVGGDLSKSLLAAGVPERQGREYVAVLGRAIPLANGLSVDDRFDLVIERTDDGKLGRLLYAGLDRIARADVELLKWTDGKNIIWVNGDGVGGERNTAMRLPVNGRVTSGFGNRFHPILGYERFHAGVDLKATYGTPIVAAADGRVVDAGWHGGYGQLVSIAHAGGIETMYGHMSRIAARSGETVRQGQVIGYVGSTGLSTGPHLHFEVLKNGRPVNPLSVKLGAVPAQLQGEKLHAFQNELRSVLLLSPARS
jgi:murein DD-endopeptidase MepM/ murein hydrolase activator NlpD